MSKLLDYFRLMRISLLPTAWSNVLMGFAISLLPGATPHQWWALLFLLMCCSCLYLAGMVMNDICDYEADCKERPERVLPSGNIEIKQAQRLFFVLAFAGILFSWLATRVNNSYSASSVGPALALLCLICVYNFRAKDSPLGPVVMGLCRTMNVLLGCSLVSTAPVVLGFGSAQLYVAGCIGLYVAGITWLAREEHQLSSRGGLILGAALMGSAIILLAIFPFTEAWSFNYILNHESLASPANVSRHQMMFVGLLAIMMFPVIRHVLVAVSTQSSRDVKQAVVVSLLTIIMIDASICYLVSPTTPAYALMVASLIVPTFLMCRRIMAT